LQIRASVIIEMILDNIVVKKGKAVNLKFKMKNSLKFLLSIISCLTLHNTNLNGQTITGNIEGSGLLYLYENDILSDSTNIINGEFSFYKQYPIPIKLTITKPGSKGRYEFLYVDPPLNVQLNCSYIWKSIVKDSKENDIYKKIRSAGYEFNAELNNSGDSVEICRELGDTLSINRLSKVNQQAWEKIANAWYSAIYENINSYAAIHCFCNWYNAYCPSPLSVDTMFLLFAQFPARVLNCIDGQKALHYFKVDSLLMPNTKIINFSAKNPDGKIISVSDFKGKYLLIDYWASWCGPCRLQAQKMLPIYLKYNNMGFEILGFSLDKNKNNWVTAINDDKIPWLQISDLKGKSSEITAIYNVDSIPFTILIDPDGNVIKSNINADDLKNELIRIFGE
jgi:peroxiredoxin